MPLATFKLAVALFLSVVSLQTVVLLFYKQFIDLPSDEHRPYFTLGVNLLHPVARKQDRRIPQRHRNVQHAFFGVVGLAVDGLYRPPTPFSPDSMTNLADYRVLMGVMSGCHVAEDYVRTAILVELQARASSPDKGPSGPT